MNSAQKCMDLTAETRKMLLTASVITSMVYRYHVDISYFIIVCIINYHRIISFLSDAACKILLPLSMISIQLNQSEGQILIYFRKLVSLCTTHSLVISLRAKLSTWPGWGRYWRTPSSRGWTPLFLRAVPTITGVNLRAIQQRLMASLISCSDGTFSTNKQGEENDKIAHLTYLTLLYFYFLGKHYS